MNSNIETAKLIEALKLVKTVVEKRNTMPILAYMLIEAKPSTIEIRCTDLQRELKLSLPNNGFCFSPICVEPNDLLTAITGSENVEIGRLPENRFFVRTESSRIELEGVNAMEFPSAMVFHATGNLQPWSEYRQAIDKVAFAMSDDVTRYNINGILFDKEGLLVATDGHQMSVEPAKALSAKDVILPASAMPFLKRAGKQIKDANTGKLNGVDGFSFSAEGLSFQIRAVDGQFPDYRQVIPRENATTCLPLPVDKKTIGAIKGIIAGVKPKDVKKAALKLEMNGEVRLSFTTNEKSQRRCVLNTAQDGKDLTIGISARYLLNAIAATDTERANVQFRGELKPILFQRKTGGYTLVMPMRFE